jgi:hypothetical protein
MLHVSRDGRHIAFRDVGAGKLVVIDRERKAAKGLVDLGANFWGLAWGPTGRDLWFTESAAMTARDVFAVDLEGRRRLVYRSAGVLTLVDTAPDGRALFHRALDRWGAMALLPGSRAEQDVTVYDNTSVGALSADGRMLLLNSQNEGAGSTFAYLRLPSPGGRRSHSSGRRKGRGHFSRREIHTHRHPGGGPRHSADRSGAAQESRPWDPPCLERKVGPSRVIPGADNSLYVSRWSGDGRSLFLGKVGGWPCEIHRLDLATERSELWKQVAPPDPTGIVYCSVILPSADGRSYVYSANRSLASLIVAEGLR